jgi:hypothetical protein
VVVICLSISLYRVFSVCTVLRLANQDRKHVEKLHKIQFPCIQGIQYSVPVIFFFFFKSVDNSNYYRASAMSALFRQRLNPRSGGRRPAFCRLSPKYAPLWCCAALSYREARGGGSHLWPPCWLMKEWWMWFI